MESVVLVDVSVAEVLPYYSRDEVAYYVSHTPTDSSICSYKDGVLETSAAVDTKIVPITHLYKDGNPLIAVAYTERFEELCGIPIRTIIEGRDRAVSEKAKVDDKLASTTANLATAELQIKRELKKADRLFTSLTIYESAPWWKRLKYFFTGTLL